MHKIVSARYQQFLRATYKDIINAKFINIIHTSRKRMHMSNGKFSRRSSQYIGIGFATALAGSILYDGVVNELIYCGAAIRFLRSLKAASLIAVDYIFIEAHENDVDYDTQLKRVHLKSAERLLETCLLNGGLYIKMGQGVAAINHILPKEYTVTLERLQDKCLPTTKTDVQRVFRKDFGNTPESIYGEFDYTPIAAASLAQVFKAKLKSGEDVAVKRVLTMEWIDGFKISDVERIQYEKLSLSDIDLKLFKMFAEQIFNTGFVHADPHPGNVYVRKSPNTFKAELVLLDHGLYEFLPESVRLPLCEFWEATVLKDEQKMKAAAKQIGIKDHMKFAEVLFQQPIRIHGGRIKTKLSESDIEYIQQMAKKNFELIMNTLKEMPRNMLFVVRNLNTVRAIGRQHGDVVDRPRTMARCAQHCIYAKRKSICSYVVWLYRRFIFEYSLWVSSFRWKCFNLYLIILYKLNRAPESARTLLSDITKQDFN
ncbi:uncharacterized aarF domain-containing protein kinase 5 isoform X2 [Eurosta solidaginis]|uniref:uncharacterized aarF domain-containing protein kinase 5 isoform X2 n=1 Tax=Eurosta solidaginis TaxID=178769 RepID=UPI0035311544